MASAATAAGSSPVRVQLRRYLPTYGLSIFGDQVAFIALSWAAASLATPTAASYVLLAASAPRALLFVAGGAAVDRIGSYRVAKFGQVARAAVLALGGIAWALGQQSPLVLGSIALAFGIADAAHLPAMLAMPARLLRPRDRPAGQGLVQAVQRVATIAAAPAAGLMLTFGGYGLTVLVVSVILVLALAPLSALREPLLWPRKPLAATEASEQNWPLTPALVALLMIVGALNFTLAAPLNLGVSMRAVEEGWGAVGLSTVIGGFAVGATIGAVGFGYLPTPDRPVVVALLSVASGSAATAGVAVAPTILLATSAAGAAGLCAGPASALLVGSMQVLAAEGQQGRLSAALAIVSVGVSPLSFAAFGPLVAWSSVSEAILLSATGQGLVAVLGLVSPTLRRVRLDPDSR